MNTTTWIHFKRKTLSDGGGGSDVKSVQERAGSGKQLRVRATSCAPIITMALTSDMNTAKKCAKHLHVIRKGSLWDIPSPFPSDPRLKQTPLEASRS